MTSPTLYSHTRRIPRGWFILALASGSWLVTCGVLIALNVIMAAIAVAHRAGVIS